MLSTAQALPPLVTLSGLSSYGLYLSYHNIWRLQEYEEQSEKAAEWSNTVAERLRKTRSTQTSGTVTLLLSFLTSTTLIFVAPSTSLSPFTLLTTASLINTTALYLSRTHMASFWNESKQTRIPFVEKFNEAIRGSEKVVWLLGTLSFAWLASGAVWVGVEKELVNGAVGLGVWSALVGARGWYMAKLGWGI